jgi:hypothetical protein
LFPGLGWIWIFKILKSPVMKGKGGKGAGWEGFNFQNMQVKGASRFLEKYDLTRRYIKISGMKPV